MKIAIVTNAAPFIYGGAEFLADSLRNKLIEYGHQSEVIRIPFEWVKPQGILEQILACRLMRLINVDRVIALKFPAYYIPHENKVMWLLHQYRQAYDFWGTPFQDLPSTPEGQGVRDAIIAADNTYLPEARRIFTNNHVVSKRLKKFNGMDSEVLLPPLMESEKYYCNKYDGYFFYPSRIGGAKRQALAIEAMAHVKTDVKLIVAGRPDHPSDLDRCTDIIRRYNLEKRVELRPTFISQEEKADLYANALGCVYIPYDEDSYGYVTLEAYHSRKAVITCTDSGGTSDVVIDNQTGVIAQPSAQSLAGAMDAMYQDRDGTARMGENGLKHIQTLGISWDRVIQKLTS